MKFPYDPRLFGILAGAGVGGSFLAGVVSRIASGDYRINEAFFFAALLCVFLAGLYTWLVVKQKDASKIIPIALGVIFCLFLAADFSDSVGNPESMGRFWSALPSFVGIIATSAAMIWQTWAPVLRAWAKPPAPAAPAPKPAAKRSSGPKAKAAGKRPMSKPPRAAEPEPAPDPTPPEPPRPEQDEENTVEDQLSKPEITTGLPRRRK